MRLDSGAVKFASESEITVKFKFLLIKTKYISEMKDFIFEN